MPNFSNEIQTNNVLTRRILALKVKDGLHIDMDEAEKKMKSDMNLATQAFQSDLKPIVVQEIVEETKTEPV